MSTGSAEKLKKTIILKKRINIFDNLVIDMRPVNLPGKPLKAAGG